MTDNDLGGADAPVVEAFCACCKDTGFPVVDEPARWTMGQMRELRFAPHMVIERVGRAWLTVDDGKFLCGDCYFDLTDEL